MIAFNGVRNSWLIFARNADLALPAVLASSRARASSMVCTRKAIFRALPFYGAPNCKPI